MDYICPYKCSYRTSSGYCGSTGGWERCQYRQLHQPNTVVGYVPPLKKTNADRIRAMTDEELSIALCLGGCPPTAWDEYGVLDCPKPNEEVCEEVCGSCWLDWLKQEAQCTSE